LLVSRGWGETSPVPYVSNFVVLITVKSETFKSKFEIFSERSCIELAVCVPWVEFTRVISRHKFSSIRFLGQPSFFAANRLLSSPQQEGTVVSWVRHTLNDPLQKLQVITSLHKPILTHKRLAKSVSVDFFES
jgi:hypothetical protein